MESIRKTLRGPLGGVLFCLLQAAVGVLLLIDPMRFTKGVVIAFGGLLALWGIICGIRYFVEKLDVAVTQRLLFRGLVAVMAGVGCVTQHALILAAFPLLAMVYAGWLLVLAALQLQRMADRLRLHTGRWYMPGIAALLAIVLAVLIFINPFGATEGLWIFVGVSLIAEALTDLACVFLK